MHEKHFIPPSFVHTRVYAICTFENRNWDPRNLIAIKCGSRFIKIISCAFALSSFSFIAVLFDVEKRTVLQNEHKAVCINGWIQWFLIMLRKCILSATKPWHKRISLPLFPFRKQCICQRLNIECMRKVSSFILEIFTFAIQIMDSTHSHLTKSSMQHKRTLAEKLNWIKEWMNAYKNEQTTKNLNKITNLQRKGEANEKKKMPRKWVKHE